jgi:hypothetical protein
MLIGTHSIIYSTNPSADRAFLRDVLALPNVDVEALIAKMKTQNIGCSPVESQDWGLVTRVSLPGGGRLGIYQPRHARPRGISLGRAAKKANKRAPKARHRRRTSTKKARRR